MDQTSALAIAGIHATILAISIAAIGVVVSLLGDKRLSILQEIIVRQQKLDATVPRKYPIALLFDHRDAKYDTEKDDVRGQVIGSVILAVSRATSCNPPECPTLADEGKTVTAGLTALVNHYPFTNLKVYGPDGPRDGPLIREPSIASYNKWLIDMESSLSGLRDLESYRGQLLQAVQAYQGGPRGQDIITSMKKEVADIQETIKRLPESDRERDKLQMRKDYLLRTLKDYESTAPNYRELIAMILDWFKSADTEIQQMSPIRHVLEHYSAMSSSWLKPIVFTSVLLTFLFGVGLPMLHKFLGQYDGNLLPYIIYVVIPICGHVVTTVCAWGWMQTIWR